MTARARAASIRGGGPSSRRRSAAAPSSAKTATTSTGGASTGGLLEAAAATKRLPLLLLLLLVLEGLTACHAFLLPSHRPHRPPPLHAHDHDHDHDHDDAVPLTLLTGLPTALAAAAPCLIRQQEGRIGVVVAAQQPGGLLASLVALQEECEGEVDENGFVLCSLGSVAGKDSEAVAEGMKTAALALAGQQGPLSRILLLAPPTLDPWGAAEVLSGHDHDHDHDHAHDHGGEEGCCGCDGGGVRLAGVMAAVDAQSFRSEWWRADPVRDRGDLALEGGKGEGEEGEEEERTVADLLCAQIEAAGRVWVILDDAMEEAAAEEVAAAVRCLNPGADVWPLEKGDEGPFPLTVPDEEDYGVEEYDVHAAEEGAGWLRLINGEEEEDDDEGEEEEGTWGMVFRARRPFHPGRLWAFVTRPGSVMAQDLVWRSKGFFWLATRHDEVGLWNQVGGSFSPGGAGAWWCVTPREEWPEGGEEEVEADFEGEYGDRRQEIAFVGVGDGGLKARLEEELHGCLLTDAEMAGGPGKWVGGMEDPFPEW